MSGLTCFLPWSRRRPPAEAAPAISTGIPIPLPTDHRGLLLQLVGHLDERGIEAFLDRFDYGGVTPHQIYAVGLGRLPESAAVAAPPPDYCAREHLATVLRSSEFQGDLMMRVARALPERRRLFFVHVPKCAGTDLAVHLKRDFAYLSQKDQDPYQVPTEALPALLQTRLRAGPRDQLAVIGHIGLNWMLNERLLRYGDSAFSIVREPLAMAVSKVNYVLTQLLGRGEHPPAHFGPWMEMLGLQDFPQAMSDAEAKACALRLLRDARVVPHNNICRFLGRDSVESTLELCASSNIELTTVSRYDAWLQQRWGIARSERANESRKYLTRADLGPDDLDHLREITRLDQIVYDRIDRTLRERGTLSLSGASL